MAKKKEKEHDPKSPRENEVDWWNDFGEGVYDCELEENEDDEKDE